MSNFFLKRKKENLGFTLIETNISVAIFLIILAAIYSIYAINQKLYIEEANSAEISQNGRVIIERMTREIRQAKQIVSNLPSSQTGAPSEIKFQDGHLPLIVEQANSQGGSLNTIILSPSSSSENDYYKDFFIKIILGTGQGQIRRIYSYDGSSKTAQVDTNWDTTPDSNSEYRIDSSFYYIRYYKDANSSVQRETSAFCFSSDQVSCNQSESFVLWNAIPPSGQSLIEIILEEHRIIGEYANILQFWGSQSISIFLELQKGGVKIDLESKIYGRNL